MKFNLGDYDPEDLGRGFSLDLGLGDFNIGDFDRISINDVLVKSREIFL